MTNLNDIKIGDYWEFKLTNGYTVNGEVVDIDDNSITLEYDEDEKIYLPYGIIKSYGKDKKWC